jgi:hypothetical protein
VVPGWMLQARRESCSAGISRLAVAHFAVCESVHEALLDCMRLSGRKQLANSSTPAGTAAMRTASGKKSSFAFRALGSKG